MTTRRDVIKKLGAGVVASATLGMPAIAQTRTIKLALPYLPTGQFSYAYVAREIGAWKKRGLDVQVLRGSGGVATLQGVLSNQFEIGVIGTPGALGAAQRAAPIKILGTVGNFHTLALIVPEDSPIKTPKDLKGKKIGQVLGTVDAPLLPIYLQRVGVDPADVQIISLEAKVLEQTLINRQVDAVPGFNASILPYFVSRKFPVRQWSYNDAGISFYLNQVFARNDFIEGNRQLVADVVDGIYEGVKFTLQDPEKSLDLHIQANPEIAALQFGRDYLSVGQSIGRLATYLEPSRTHGLGYSDFADVTKQAKLVKETLTKDVTSDIPPTESYVTNEYAGRVKLTQSEWDAVRTSVKSTAELVNIRI